MDEEDECSDAGEVGRPRHHHQQDRRHVVDEHLPENEEREIHTTCPDEVEIEVALADFRSSVC